MHRPTHADALPDGVAPIPCPDTEQEAEMLLLLLDAGFYPKCTGAENPPDDPGPPPSDSAA